MNRELNLRQAVTRSPYIILILMTFALFGIMPLVEGLVGRSALGIMFALVSIAALSSIWQSRRAFLICVVLILPSAISNFSGNHPGLGALHTIGSFSIIVFDILVLLIIFRDIFFRHREVGMQTVLGAVCGYIWIGFLFAHVYRIIDFYDPSAFSLGEDLPLYQREAKLTYFSFVTMTTLGYGDISPGSAAAQGYSVLEALTGELYMAVVIARMVGIVRPGKLLAPKHDDSA